MKMLILIFAAGSLFACAPNSNNNNDNGVYAYEFAGNGCSTGPQRPGTPQDRCEYLRNDGLNGYCASDRRYQEFQSSCVGQSWNRGGDNLGPQARPGNLNNQPPQQNRGHEIPQGQPPQNHPGR